MSLLQPQQLAQLDQLSVQAKDSVHGALSGHHRSTHRGSSLEFTEHRQYYPGDEIRHIDWKVLAKADRYYIKQFEQESQLQATLVLDASASMSYGSGDTQKRLFAARLCGCMAYILSKQRDRVGLTVAGEKDADHWLPRSSQRGHLKLMLETLEEVTKDRPGGIESISTALETLAKRRLPRRGLVFVVSDFFDDEGDPMEVLKHIRAGGHEVVCVQVLHRDEIEFPFEELSVFRGLESGEDKLVDPPSIQKTYLRAFENFCGSLRDRANAFGFRFLQADTSMSPVDLTALLLAPQEPRSQR